MATPDIDAATDRLYQLPLDEFTSARNALAKELKRPTIKDLGKPSVAAWAVNQLYWKHRTSYDAVIAAGQRLRAEHRQLLTGKPAAIRDAEKAHREAIRAAADEIKSLLTDGGHALTDQTLAAVQETLQALPFEDRPGRLTRPLKPAGFEALAGVRRQTPDARRQTPGARRQTPDGPRQAPGASPLKLVKSATDDRRARDAARRREQDDRERKERQREAQKALKGAEAAMLRAEEAVKKAERALGELRARRDEAVSAYQRARLRAHE